MGTLIGSRKRAAIKIGIPYERYETLLAQGRKRCVVCKLWKPSTFFGSNRARGDGFQQCCLKCSRERCRKYYQIPSKREAASKRYHERKQATAVRVDSKENSS